MADAPITDAEILLEQVHAACQRLKMAPTTFGRQAVNDGKFVSRLEQGGRVTLQTVERVHRFIEQQDGIPSARLRASFRSIEARPTEGFRFYDNRQKYLMFVNTTSEKEIVADRAILEIAETQPVPPAIRVFDGGAGDGTALARIMRGMHQRYRWLPFYVVAKEISLENVRLTLEKMSDRFQEHPATMLAVTNLKYSEAPWLRPSSPAAATSMIWKEVVLKGDSAGEFEEQIAQLRPFLREHWQASISSRSGNPVYRTPVVLVIYREDQRFLLDPIRPRRGQALADFDFVLASQPYRARSSIDFKVRTIIAPLVRALRPNGRLMGVHSHGNDPGLEVIRAVWPSESPFQHGRRAIMNAVKSELGDLASSFRFHSLSDAKAIFRYAIHTLPTEITPETEIGSSTLLAAWIAASYVAQIEDTRLEAATTNERYLSVTRDVLLRHHGLWFNDEMYVVSRRAALG